MNGSTSLSHTNNGAGKYNQNGSSAHDQNGSSAHNQNGSSAHNQNGSSAHTQNGSSAHNPTPPTILDLSPTLNYPIIPPDPNFSLGPFNDEDITNLTMDEAVDEGLQVLPYVAAAGPSFSYGVQG